MSKAGLVAVGLVSISLVAMILFAGLSFARFSRDLPSIDLLPVLMDRESGELLQPTRVLDRTGGVTLFTYQDEGVPREFLSIDPQAGEFISPQLVRAVTAVFDPTFWTNPGYEIKQWNNPEPQTIAERLVSDLVLWQEAPSTARAIRMRLLAGQVVSTFSRTRIIEWYLNSAWYGRYAYGAESAARLYLGKSARDLTLAESALLTAVLRSPALNPLDAPATALQMQKELLTEMLTKGVINQEEYDLATKEEITIRETEQRQDSAAEGFIRQVEKQLEPVMGRQRLQRGGLLVYTTLDADLQEQLICTTTTQLMRVQYSNLSGVAPEGFECRADLLLPTQNFSAISSDSLAAAGLVMNPENGEVLAYLEPLTISGERLNDSGYQPGSLLTPMVALNAFSRGYSPASLVWDIPAPGEILNDAEISAYHGPVNLRNAIANDYLNPIAALAKEIGAVNVWRSSAALGLTSLENAPDQDSLLYTGGETNLLQLGTAYAIFANSGVRSGRSDPISGEILPQAVKKVTSTSGSVLYEEPDARTSAVLDQTLAYLVNHVLSDESARWPSLGYPNELEVGSPVAAKTGSAQDHRQVWAIGYNPQRLVLIWMGSRGQIGSPLDVRMPAGIWHALYKYATRENRFAGWTQPAGISAMKVCSPSGMLPTADCPEITTDVFLYGNEPSMPDSLYVTARVNRETGLLATVFTPPDLVEERTYLNVPPDAREWAERVGLELVPTGYDAIQAIRVDPEVNISTPTLFSAVSGRVIIRGTVNLADLSSFQVQVGEGINPDAWQQLGTTTRHNVINGTLAVWDTNDLNGLYAIRLSAVNSKNMIRTAVIQVTVDNTAPQARITYPQTGAAVEPVRGGVTLNAIVEDQVGISQVEWWVDGRLAFTQSSPPYVYQLRATSGRHKAYLRILDTAGNSATTEEINFQIEQ